MAVRVSRRTVGVPIRSPDRFLRNGNSPFSDENTRIGGTTNDFATIGTTAKCAGGGLRPHSLRALCQRLGDAVEAPVRNRRISDLQQSGGRVLPAQSAIRPRFGPVPRHKVYADVQKGMPLVWRWRLSERRESMKTEERLDRIEYLMTALAVLALEGSARLNPSERASAVRGAKEALTEFLEKDVTVGAPVLPTGWW